MDLFFSGAHWSQNLLIINLWQHCVGEREREKERERVHERKRERERGDIESVRGECVRER